MSSAAESEIGALYITAKEIFPIRQTLIEMVREQPPLQIQTDNSTAAGVVNKIIIKRKSKSMDLRFHWLRCRESHHLNWGDYCKKHPSPIYHTNNRPQFSGYVNIFKKNKNINEDKDHLPDSRSLF